MVGSEPILKTRMRMSSAHSAFTVKEKAAGLPRQEAASSLLARNDEQNHTQ
jgi:hypothetical protein